MNNFLESKFKRIEEYIAGNKEALRELNLIKTYIINRKLGYEIISEEKMQDGTFQRVYKKDPQIDSVEAIRQQAELIIQACIKIQKPLLENEEDTYSYNIRYKEDGNGD